MKKLFAALLLCMALLLVGCAAQVEATVDDVKGAWMCQGVYDEELECKVDLLINFDVEGVYNTLVMDPEEGLILDSGMGFWEIEDGVVVTTNMSGTESAVYTFTGKKLKCDGNSYKQSYAASAMFVGGGL